MPIRLIKTEIPDLFVIELQVFGDDRGYFLESYNQKDFQREGLGMRFVQDNESRSKKGVLRGLHFQRKLAQGKLVRCTEGEVFDVAVDLRKGSPTYKKWFGINLSHENKRQFYVPEGFAHGFVVLSEFATFQYKCTNYYAPEYEGGISWDDPEIGIEWPLVKEIEICLSEKDKKLKTLKETDVPFVYENGGEK